MQLCAQLEETHQTRLIQSEVNICSRAVLAHLTLCIQTVLVFKGRKGLRLPSPAAGTTLALVLTGEVFVQPTVCLRHSAEPAFCTQPDKSTSSGVSMKPKETAESLV